MKYIQRFKPKQSVSPTYAWNNKDKVQEAKVTAFMQGQETTMRKIYAATLITLREQLGFGRERMERFMRAMDSVVWQCISDDDVVEDAFRKTGIEVDFSEAFSEDRIKDVLNGLKDD